MSYSSKFPLPSEILEAHSSEILEKPESIDEVKVSSPALLLTGIYTPKDRMGKISAVDQQTGNISLKFPRDNYNVSLNHYGKVWVLLRC